MLDPTPEVTPVNLAREPAYDSSRITELDGLRGVAIFMVMSFHYINNQLHEATTVPARVLYKLTSYGWVGVDLFFVLSGYLIGSILIANSYSQNLFTTFYVRRIARIFPTYYLLVICFLVMTSLPSLNANDFLTGNRVLPDWSYLTFTNNIYMAWLNNMGNKAMSISWSIAIEEQFYLIFPLVIYLLRKTRYLPAVLIVAIVAAPVFRSMFAGWIAPYVLLMCRMDSIAAGALVAYCGINYDLGDVVRKYRFHLLGALLGLIGVCGMAYYLFHDIGSVRHTLFAFCFAIILLFSLTMKKWVLIALLRNKWLVFVGTISYSLYLFHYLVLGLTHQLMSGNADIGMHNSRDLMVTVIAFVISILLASLLYKFVEKPIMKYGKRFSY
jgi:peptidoglycan/LPS O-acetylase OafA/YrhL